MNGRTYFVLLLFLVTVYLLLTFIVQPRLSFSESTPTSTIEVFLDDKKLWNLVQKWRKSQGLAEYVRDQRLCRIAEDRSDDPIDYHKGFEEKYGSKSVNPLINYPFIMQENVVFNYLDEESSLNGWLNSPPHRATLKKPYTHSCIRCYETTCVQIFGQLENEKTL